MYLSLSFFFSFFFFFLSFGCCSEGFCFAYHSLIFRVGSNHRSTLLVSATSGRLHASIRRRTATQGTTILLISLSRIQRMAHSLPCSSRRIYTAGASERRLRFLILHPYPIDDCWRNLIPSSVFCLFHPLICSPFSSVQCKLVLPHVEKHRKKEKTVSCEVADCNIYPTIGRTGAGRSTVCLHSINQYQ